MVDGYCVKWEKHHNAIVSVFDNLYKHNILVDCTLAAENRSIKAHRIVLMACSPYFEDLLSQHSDNYPIVWMNMKFSELQALIDFCYRGEVRLPQAELPGFLNAARLLHIKGLCESSDNYRKRRNNEGGGAAGGTKKKHRASIPGGGLVHQVSVGNPTHEGQVLTPRSIKTEVTSEEADGDDTEHPTVQTNGGDSVLHLQGDENSDRSDLDTDDDESSAGEEKELIMLDDLIRGSGVAQFLYRWTCSKCGEAFPTRATYQEHKRGCNAEMGVHPWRCHKCPSTYKNKKDLVRHLLYCGTETERHICERCGSTYKYERGLKRHKIYCGTDVQPMVCNACGKTYKYKRGLRRHQKQQCGLVDAYLENRVPKRRGSEINADTDKKVSPQSKTASTPSLFKFADDEDQETPHSSSKEVSPSVCPTCGKVYKYRKPYQNHIINCIPTDDNTDNTSKDDQKPSGLVLKIEQVTQDTDDAETEEQEDQEEDKPECDDDKTEGEENKGEEDKTEGEEDKTEEDEDKNEGEGDKTEENKVEEDKTEGEEDKTEGEEDDNEEKTIEPQNSPEAESVDDTPIKEEQENNNTEEPTSEEQPAEEHPPEEHQTSEEHSKTPTHSSHKQP